MWNVYVDSDEIYPHGVVAYVNMQCHSSVSPVFQLSLGKAEKVQEIKRGLGTTN